MSSLVGLNPRANPLEALFERTVKISMLSPIQTAFFLRDATALY
jgi:hypothetical protein